MIVNDLIRAVLFAALLFVVQFGKFKPDRTFIVILTCIILSEISAQFFNSSRATIMPIAVPVDRRVDAASTSMFSLTGVAIAATAAGPALFSLLGAEVAVSTCIATYIISCIMTLRIDDRCQPNRHAAGHFWHGWRLSLRRLAGNQQLCARTIWLEDTWSKSEAIRTIGDDVSRRKFKSVPFSAESLSKDWVSTAPT